MKIISHRGYWLDPKEKNTRKSFERSFSMGFGTETDIRDSNGKLVISHDMASDNCLLVEDFFEIYNKYDNSLTLALNIKSDGLQDELKTLIEKYRVKNYFVFDMAVPDGVIYAEKKLEVYTRQSEYEPVPAYYDKAKGIWLDEFIDHWLTDDEIIQHIKNKKDICLVSPELHNRVNSNEWFHYLKLEQRIGKNQLALCTDYPELADKYFNHG